MAESYDLGKKAEELAVEYLRSAGYTILERNFRFERAEVDIIAANDTFLVAIEVKARSTDYFGSPEAFVTPKKIRLLVSAVDHYIAKSDLSLEVRFDIITYTKKGNIFYRKHIEDAFSANQ